MLIKRIDVSNFRKLTGPVTVDGFAPGVNVVWGSNEEGKSTLLQAIRAAFCQRYNATGQAVKSFQPYGSAVRPEVEVEFELSDGGYKILKSFCLKAAAELRTPNGTFQGPEAEEKIRDLFRLGNAFKGRKASESDAGLLGLLWLEQAAAERGLEMTSSGREGLLKVVESNLESITSGDEGRALIKAIKTKYEEYFTSTAGRERGPLKEQRAQAALLAQQYDECRLKFEQYRKRMLDLADNQELLSKHRRERTLDTAQRDVDSLSADIQQITKLELELKTLEQHEKTAKLEHDALSAKVKKRAELTKKIEEQAAEQLERKTALSRLSQQIDETQRDFEALEKEWQALELELSKLEKACALADRQEKIQAMKVTISSVEKQLSTLADLEQSLTSLKSSYGEHTVDEKALTELRRAQEAKKEADIRLTSVTTRVILRPAEGRTASMENSPIDVDDILQLTSPAVIKLDNWGEIEIVPGGQDLDQLIRTAEKRTRALQKQLSDAGCATVQEAEAKVEKRKSLASEVSQAEARISGITSGRDAEELRKHLSTLKGECDRLSSDLATESCGEDASELRRKHQALVQKERATRSQVDSLKSTLNSKQVELAAVSSQLDNATTRLSDLQAELASLGDGASESEAMTKTEHDFLTAQNSTKIKRLELAKFNPEQVAQKLIDAKRHLERVEKEIRAVEDRVTQLSAEVNTSGEAGISEDLERLKGATEQSAAQLERTERYSGALKLLYDTLVECEQDIQSQLFQPVLNKLKPYLNGLFPGAGLSIDPTSAEIDLLSRNGVTEKFIDLSVGTREQLSVLTRVAVAELALESGQPSVIMLDDALVYCDNARFKTMKEILEQVGSRMQVIIFTCRRSEYDDMKNARMIDFQPARRAVASGKSSDSAKS